MLGVSSPYAPTVPLAVLVCRLNEEAVELALEAVSELEECCSERAQKVSVGISAVVRQVPLVHQVPLVEILLSLHGVAVGRASSQTKSLV